MGLTSIHEFDQETTHVVEISQIVCLSILLLASSSRMSPTKNLIFLGNFFSKLLNNALEGYPQATPTLLFS